MFIARPGPKTGTAVWGGMTWSSQVTNILIMPPQTAKVSYGRDFATPMPLLTELPPAIWALAFRRQPYRISRQWPSTENSEEPGWLFDDFSGIAGSKLPCI